MGRESFTVGRTLDFSRSLRGPFDDRENWDVRAAGEHRRGTGTVVAVGQTSLDSDLGLAVRRDRYGLGDSMGGFYFCPTIGVGPTIAWERKWLRSNQPTKRPLDYHGHSACGPLAGLRLPPR